MLVIVETSISPPLIYITEIVQNVRITTNVPPIHAPIALPHEVTRPQPPSMSPRQLLGQTADVPSGRFIAVLLCALPVHMLVVEVGVESDLQEKSDQQLLILAREDSRVFAVLYGRHHHHIYSYALGILHDRDLAENVAEETFARLTSRLGWLASTRRPLLPWLYCVARNCAMDELRRRRREGLLGITDIACSDPDDDTVKNIEAHAPEILNAISSLNPFECASVILRHIKRMATKDVARELGCHPRKVTAALNHAYGLLRRKLSDI